MIPLHNLLDPRDRFKQMRTLVNVLERDQVELVLALRYCKGSAQMALKGRKDVGLVLQQIIDEVDRVMRHA